jgi:hypothetical protein
MRSVFVHLTGCTRPEVEHFLSRHHVCQDGQWLQMENDDPVLYISIYEDAATECEPEELDRIRSALGGEIAVSVTADVSGRYPAFPEVMTFVSLILDRFAGIADDDHGGLWTIDQIRQRKLFKGRHFFDNAANR